MVTAVLNILFITVLIWGFWPRYRSKSVRVIDNDVTEVIITKSRNILPRWTEIDLVYLGKDYIWFRDGVRADSIELERIRSAILEANVLGNKKETTTT